MAPVFAPPEVIARLREPVLATQLLQRDALIRLPQESDDMFFAKPLLHVQPQPGLDSKPFRYSKQGGRRNGNKIAERTLAVARGNERLRLVLSLCGPTIRKVEKNCSL
jgi:hypothetical protein